MSAQDFGWPTWAEMADEPGIWHPEAVPGAVDHATSEAAGQLMAEIEAEAGS
jgi:hypothetical protein